MKYDIFGIGSALMDFLIEVEHDELIELNLKKGQFHLIDENQSKELLKKLEKYNVKTSPGGSSANTLYGAALLGSNVVFCGKVGKDKHGDIYEQKMVDGNVKPTLARAENITGHAITFITPDSERTFAVHLGAAVHLEKDDVFFEDLNQSRILHIEGYQLEDKNLRDVSLHAMQFAKKKGVKISIDLGDPGIVSRNKADIKKMVNEYADIVFANEEEANALTGLEPLEALKEIAQITDIAIVKVGKKGSYIKQGEKVYEIPPYEAKAVDTTGAGDMFAAGVLYGISQGRNLNISGRIGSYFAAKVVEKIGARLDKIEKREVEEVIASIK
jgi:sugar/nucleoside kinase (ribokinase family)